MLNFLKSYYCQRSLDYPACREREMKNRETNKNPADLGPAPEEPPTSYKQPLIEPGSSHSCLRLDSSARSFWQPLLSEERLQE